MTAGGSDILVKFLNVLLLFYIYASISICILIFNILYTEKPSVRTFYMIRNAVVQLLSFYLYNMALPVDIIIPSEPKIYFSDECGDPAQFISNKRSKLY